MADEAAAPSSLFLSFTLDARTYGIRLAAVERIVRAAETLPLPDAPDSILGILNVGGRIIPLASLRRRFGLPDRTLTVSDHIILARTRRRAVALAVDQAGGVIDGDRWLMTKAADILPALATVDGVAAGADGMIIIHDLDAFLSLDEEAALTAALESTAGQATEGQATLGQATAGAADGV